MNFSKNRYNIILLALISVFLLCFLFKWIDYLFKNNYIKSSSFLFVEGLTDMGSPTTNHNVNIPLTTTYSCKNMCGPTSRCSITGQQCSSDIDCPGCQPYTPPLKEDNVSIPGENAAGILSNGVTPNYSSLTTDIGTQSKLVTSNKFEKPVMPNFGVDTWSGKFDNTNKLFDDRYKPSGLTNMPSYPDRYSLSGQFVEEGPLASNSYLS